MKKFISLLIAIAMVSSLFAISVSATAPNPLPASVEFQATAAVANAEQIGTYEEEVDEVPEGYTLYVISFAQDGLGDWENTQTGTTNAKLKQPTGFLPASMWFELDFNAADFAKIYDDTTAWYVDSLFSWAANCESNAVSFECASWSNSVAYPLNAKTESTLAERATIASFYIPISGNVSGTVYAECVMSDYSNGAQQTMEANDDITKEYSEGQSNVSYNPANLSIGAPTTYTVTYYDENGSTPALQTNSGLSSGAATPAAPSYTPAAGYQLDGWSTTQGGAVASIPATVSANADYYAVVSQIDYTVTFYNGETPVSTKTDYHYGDTLVAPADPSKAGFTFSGWSTSPSGAVADLPATVTGGAVYYAQFVEDGPSLPADIERKAGRAISKFTSANGALPTLKPGQTATVGTDADYYITEFDTNALKFAEYDYAIKATADDESYMVFDKIDGANLAEVAGNINFFVIVKKVTDRAHEIVNIVVKAFEK